MGRKSHSSIVDSALRDMAEGKGRKRVWKSNREALIPGHRVHNPTKTKRSSNWREYLNLLDQEDDEVE